MKVLFGIFKEMSLTRGEERPFVVLPEGLSEKEERDYVSVLLFGNKETSAFGHFLKDQREAIEVINGQRCVRAAGDAPLTKLREHLEIAEAELRRSREAGREAHGEMGGKRR